MIPAAMAFAATALAALFGAGVARRLGWIDRREGALAARKPRREPVALVGGAAILAGLAAGAWTAGALGRPVPALPVPALVGAFLLGLADDRLPRGLRPAAKLAGQIGVGLLLALEADSFPERALLASLAVVAMNAINTFDNADGAATALAALALSTSPVTGAATAGFLPANLGFRDGLGGRRDTRGRRLPLAYLGDSGAHVLGVLVAWHPLARPALVLPLLDLARLSASRWRRGSRPWVGDRRHLAHRLEAAGLGPATVAATCALLGAPPLVGAWLAAGSAWGLGLGAAVTVLGFTLAVLATPDPEAREGPDAAGPCSGARAGR